MGVELRSNLSVDKASPVDIKAIWRESTRKQLLIGISDQMR